MNIWIHVDIQIQKKVKNIMMYKEAGLLKALKI
nr:MAG TPA: hypothetical protein [Caudoviricetes sp.]